MPKKILVVDDLATQRVSAVFALEAAGYQVSQAKDGQEAIEQAQNTSFDLVITDLTMPTMDGMELLQSLKAQSVTSGMPILFSIQESQIERKDELRESGAVGWVMKPFKPDQLTMVVKKIIA